MGKLAAAPQGPHTTRPADLPKGTRVVRPPHRSGPPTTRTGVAGEAHRQHQKRSRGWIREQEGRICRETAQRDLPATGSGTTPAAKGRRKKVGKVRREKVVVDGAAPPPSLRPPGFRQATPAAARQGSGRRSAWRRRWAVPPESLEPSDAGVGGRTFSIRRIQPRDLCVLF